MVATIRECIAASAYDRVLELLRESLAPSGDFAEQIRAARLLKAIPPDALKLRPLKLAVLASSSVDQLIEVLQCWLILEGFSPEFWIAPFDTITPSILDQHSDLYAFRPEFLWICETFRDIKFDLQGRDVLEARQVIAEAVDARAVLWETAIASLNATIIQNNADIPTEDVFGNYAAQVDWSRRSLLRRYNVELAARAPRGVVIFDLDHISALSGKRGWSDRRYWHHSKSAFDFSRLGEISFRLARLIGAQKGYAKKCVVLDLDNTLWGGVIGDDGIDGIRIGNGADGEAFVEFQKWLKELKTRGVILAVCSKNDDHTAREPFLRHPDMQLRLEDFAVFRANWTNKAETVVEIANTLNIGLDSLVFVDDNPVERDIVRRFAPGVVVPELPEDPSGYIEAISRGLHFETVSFSAEDRARTNFYRDNSAREELKSRYLNQDEYLAQLEMVAEVGILDSLHLPRIAQLVNKSNQFNLTTKRYSESDLARLNKEVGTDVVYFRLSDRFGDNGLVSVVVTIARSQAVLEIDLWVMSCRVLARSMEEFIFNHILEIARRRGCSEIVGRYIATEKNGLVAGLYARLGFEKIADEHRTTVWRRAVGEPISHLLTHVRTDNSQMVGIDG